MENTEISSLLSSLDGRGTDQEYEAIRQLEAFGLPLPQLLLEKYSRSKKYDERASCVYHCIKYAQTDKNAYDLGIIALNDKSKVVRYRACMLLAVAQNSSAIPSLKKLLDNNDSAADATAAIDAIASGNHNYFVDRTHSGTITLIINS